MAVKEFGYISFAGSPDEIWWVGRGNGEENTIARGDFSRSTKVQVSIPLEPVIVRTRGGERPAAEYIFDGTAIIDVRAVWK